ncbi:MAG: arsenate reductase ArsC [Elusimicrobia bacterium]|nr:arsenate reductase ArsC [Elusimicrobiota bacterium]MDA8242807.1 arsenate reductase ArsC [Elusimicrobiota bacterium]
MKRILFLCTGNSCRSQMAEGWANALLAGKARAFSAGTAPGDAVDTRAIKVMAEAGIDISGGRPKSVGEFKDMTFDLVVTVCSNAERTCPAYWGSGRKLHRGFDDPGTVAGKGSADEAALPVYRRVRDEIREFVKGLEI